MIVSLVGLISLPALGALVDRLSLPTSLILLGIGFMLAAGVLMLFHKSAYAVSADESVQGSL